MRDKVTRIGSVPTYGASREPAHGGGRPCSGPPSSSATTPIRPPRSPWLLLAGLTAVITGAVAALSRKGSPRHIRAGRWYYGAIGAVFATATVLAAMRRRQDYYLFLIGGVAFIAATIGYLHRRRHRPGDTGHIAGMGTPYVAMLTAFYVDNGPHLPLWDHLPLVAFWLLPTAIG